MQLFFVLFSATLLMLACQKPAKPPQIAGKVDPNTGNQGAGYVDTSTTETSTVSNTGDAMYSDEEKYYAATDEGKFARITVYVQESSSTGYLDVQLAFKALRVINTKTVSGQNTATDRTGRRVEYPQLLVTLPLSSYRAGEHTNSQHYQQLPAVGHADGKYRVYLKQMKKGNSFRLKFEILKSALTSGQLNMMFNLQFDSPYIADLTQFVSESGALPHEGSFPRQ